MINQDWTPKITYFQIYFWGIFSARGWTQERERNRTPLGRHTHSLLFAVYLCHQSPTLHSADTLLQHITPLVSKAPSLPFHWKLPVSSKVASPECSVNQKLRTTINDVRTKHWRFLSWPTWSFVEPAKVMSANGAWTKGQKNREGNLNFK